MFSGVQRGSTERNLLYLYIFTEETRCAGFSSSRSGWFKRIEPPRTVLNHRMTELARCVEFFHSRTTPTSCERTLPATVPSGWFKRLEPHRTFSNHSRTELAGRVEFFHRSSEWFDARELHRRNTVCRVLVHAFGVVHAHRTSSNLLEPHQDRDSRASRVLSEAFRVVRLYGTFSNYRSSEWFDCTEPSLPTSSQKKQGVQGSRTQGRGGSSA